MDINSQRARVIEVARTFVGTPYHSNAKIKGVGVDCGTLLIMVYEEAGVRPPMHLSHYSPQFHMHSDEPLYEKEITKNGAHQVDAPGLGDIVLYFQGQQFAHGAIVSKLDPLWIIHAYAPGRCVLEGAEHEFGVIRNVAKKFFSPW